MAVQTSFRVQLRFKLNNFSKVYKISFEDHSLTRVKKAGIEKCARGKVMLAHIFRKSFC